jgi:RND superfamily putative drug exporter
MAAQHEQHATGPLATVGGRPRWGRTVVRIRWPIIAAAVATVVLGITWGAGVFSGLSSGGFDDPGGESVRTSERIANEIGRRDADLVVLYSSSAATVDQPAFRNPVVAAIGELRQRPDVASVVSFYDAGAPGLVSTDRHATYATITLRAADDDGKLDQYEAIRPALDAPGLTTEVGGVVAVQAAADAQVERDLARGEMIALPVVLALLVLIFGGLVAAGMPLLVGILAILGALTATRLLTAVTDVSTFAVNTILLLGLGMAIDYSLLVVTRFREELHAGPDARTAVARTMSTAGRTVLVSGLTIALALSSLLIFPQVFLRSLGMGGMAAVLVAMLGALTVLPAVLSILGPRIDAWQVPLPWRRRARRSAPTAASHGAWARLARTVMRHPVGYLAGVVLVLAVLASPFLRAQFSGADERVLPADTQARVVAQRIATEFPGGTVAPIDTFVDGASPEQVRDLVADITALPGVTGAAVSDRHGDASLISVAYAGERTSEQAHAAVRAIRDLPIPDGVDVLVGGRTAADIDRLDSLGDRLPWMAGIMAAATLILLFLAFGSVLLPIKAVLMNLVSIGASFGVVVWIFQDGHLADWLGFTPTGFLEPSIPILIFAVLFGLATDYEVFLLSRIREAWDATGDNTDAVVVGLQRTGRTITSAALLLVVVVAGFAAGEVVFAKMIGIGMITAIVVDATLVRALLVPATMRLLGRWNWWAPGPLARLYRRYGIRETAEPASDPRSPAVPAAARAI